MAVLFYNNGGTDAVVTFTGQVPQGTYNVAHSYNSQFTLVGSPVPIGGDVTNSTTVLGLVPSSGDTAATFNSAANDWNPVTKWSSSNQEMGGSASSTIAVGQGFLYYNNNATPTTGLAISQFNNINTHNKTTKQQNNIRQPQTHYPEYEKTTHHCGSDTGLRRRIRSRQVVIRY